MGTIQEALKQLYYSLGGNADNVRDMTDPMDIINKIAKLDIGEAISAKAAFPEYPEEDGTYQLQLVMDEGAPTLTWEAVE